MLLLFGAVVGVPFSTRTTKSGIIDIFSITSIATGAVVLGSVSVLVLVLVMTVVITPNNNLIEKVRLLHWQQSCCFCENVNYLDQSLLMIVITLHYCHIALSTFMSIVIHNSYQTQVPSQYYQYMSDQGGIYSHRVSRSPSTLLFIIIMIVIYVTS